MTPPLPRFDGDVQTLRRSYDYFGVMGGVSARNTLLRRYADAELRAELSRVFIGLFGSCVLQKDHPQNPTVREGSETEEEKLSRALGMAKTPKGEGLRGYDGFLALLYAFLEQPTTCEV